MIAIVIAFSRLSLRDNGILHNLLDGNLFGGNKDLMTSLATPDVKEIQEGKQLQFGGDEKTRPFTLTYGKLISREPSLVGRSTVVLHAATTRSEWEGIDLVVKISWPGSIRVPESRFLRKAIEEAGRTPNQWALNHLPRLLFDQDIVFGPDSTNGKVASLFKDADFVNGEYKYEERTLRIIVQECLYPITTLIDVKDIAQVLLDVACGTYFHWHPSYH